MKIYILAIIFTIYAVSHIRLSGKIIFTLHLNRKWVASLKSAITE